MKNTKTRYLSEDEALILGFDLKAPEKFRRKARYSVTHKDWDNIQVSRSESKERKFVEIQKKYDKAGDVISTIEKLQSEPIEVPEDFEIIKVSTSKTTGQQWVQYAKKKSTTSICTRSLKTI